MNKQGPNKDKYGRTTITVPRPLKRRMRQADCRVNWSAVACEAFRKKLAQVEARERQSAAEELPSKEDAIERLKRMKAGGETASNSAVDRGLASGRRWAMSDAHPDELARLEKFCGNNGIEKPIEEWSIDLNKPAEFKQLVRRMTLRILNVESGEGGRPPRRPGVVLWQERIGVEMPPEPRWLQGFASGALGFWREVKDQI